MMMVLRRVNPLLYVLMALTAFWAVSLTALISALVGMFAH